MRVAEPKPFFVAGESVRRELPRLPTNPTALRKQLLVEELAQEDWSAPNVGALAHQLVQQELASPARDVRTFNSASGTRITIRRVEPTPAAPPPEQKVAALEASEAREGYPLAVMSTRNPDPSNLRPLWLMGQVEMTEGLAFVGPETQMTIQRVFNGHAFEAGRIWISEGRFEIRVKEPVGYLVAELRTRQGRVLGRGEINLLDLRALPAREDRVANLRIPLRPTTDGVAFHAVSGHSYGAHKMPVTTASVEVQAYSQPQKVNEEGLAVEPGLSRDSSFVARAVARDHWPSIVVGQAREPQDIRLFSKSLVNALINLNSEGSRSTRKEIAQKSVIWGRLVQDGRPAQGAQIEMAGDYKPIYFDEMYIPNPKLNATSSNGLFAFINVRRGVQALRVKAGDRTYPAQVFPTENRHVSYVELNIRSREISQFKVFDAFDSSKAVQASLRMVGTNEVLPVGKDDFVEYAVAANPFMVEADAGGEFEVSRVTVTGNPHVVHVPMVGRSWMYELAQSRQIYQASTRGAVVGLIDDGGYEVELTGYPSGETMQIVYFDAQGKPLNSRTGITGGGFAIFNAPPGLQTLYVHGNQTRETFSQIVVAEPTFVSVVTH
jgi:hypothetical protein